MTKTFEFQLIMTTYQNYINRKLFAKLFLAYFTNRKERLNLTNDVSVFNLIL